MCEEHCWLLRTLNHFCFCFVFCCCRLLWEHHICATTVLWILLCVRNPWGVDDKGYPSVMVESCSKNWLMINSLAASGWSECWICVVDFKEIQSLLFSLTNNVQNQVEVNFAGRTYRKTSPRVPSSVLYFRRPLLFYCSSFHQIRKRKKRFRWRGCVSVAFKDLCRGDTTHHAVCDYYFYVCAPLYCIILL